jgi:glycosyltransferase involved in cell wall biosynthesis
VADAADPESWVRALDRLLDDPALADRLGAAAHTDYATHFTWTVRARRILEHALP